MSRYVLCIPLIQQSPEQFMAYVRGLRILPEVAPDSKSAKGIKLGIGKDGVVRVYCKREVKAVTESEIQLLCTEYSLDPLTFTELLTKRKFTITNGKGEVTNGKRISRKRRPIKTATERNAHLDQNSEWASRPNQLFQSGPAANLPEESTLLPESEPKTTTGV